MFGTLKTLSVNYLDQEQYFPANQFERDADAPWIERVSTNLIEKSQLIAEHTNAKTAW